MTFNDVQARLAPVWERHPEVRCAYLFGSMASGRAGPGSDVDLAVAADAPLAAQVRHDLQEACAEALGREVDLIDLRRATGLVLKHALRGICLFCHDTGTRAAMIRRLIYDQEDMQPIRRKIMDLRRQAFTARKP